MGPKFVGASLEEKDFFLFDLESVWKREGENSGIDDVKVGE